MTGRRSAQDEDLRNGGAVRFRRLVEFEVRDFAVAVRGCLRSMFRYVAFCMDVEMLHDQGQAFV